MLKKHTGNLTLCHQMSPFSEGGPVCLQRVPVSARLYLSVYSGEYDLGQQRGKGSGREVEESPGSGPLPHGAQARTHIHTRVRLALFFPSPTMITCR